MRVRKASIGDMIEMEQNETELGPHMFYTFGMLLHKYTTTIPIVRRETPYGVITQFQMASTRC